MICKQGHTGMIQSQTSTLLLGTYLKHPNLEKLSETYNRAIMANSTFRENCLQRQLAEPEPKKPKQNCMKKGE